MPGTIINNGGDGTDYSKQAAPPGPGDVVPPQAATGKDGAQRADQQKFVHGLLRIDRRGPIVIQICDSVMT